MTFAPEHGRKFPKPTHVRRISQSEDNFFCRCAAASTVGLGIVVPLWLCGDRSRVVETILWECGSLLFTFIFVVGGWVETGPASTISTYSISTTWTHGLLPSITCPACKLGSAALGGVSHEGCMSGIVVDDIWRVLACSACSRRLSLGIHKSVRFHS